MDRQKNGPKMKFMSNHTIRMIINGFWSPRGYEQSVIKKCKRRSQLAIGALSPLSFFLLSSHVPMVEESVVTYEVGMQCDSQRERVFLGIEEKSTIKVNPGKKDALQKRPICCDIVSASEDAGDQNDNQQIGVISSLKNEFLTKYIAADWPSWLITIAGEAVKDFGMATYFNTGMKHPLTNQVATLWYRSPELLLGVEEYGAAVDLWSCGCVLAELLIGAPFIPGRTEIEQLHLIFKLCGSPSKEYLRKSNLPHAAIFKSQHPYKNIIRQEFSGFPSSTVALLEQLLAMDPCDRGTSSSALASNFFSVEPIACDPSSLPICPPI